MQCAKDSFFLALQSRLAGLNPARTVTINGTTVPAMLVTENLPPAAAEPQPNTFYIEWGRAGVADGHAGDSALMGMECVISYYTLGTVGSMVDRGRVLGELDDELLGICQPTNTGKVDYTQAPGADLGTSVFWEQPVFAEGRKNAVADETVRQPDGRVERYRNPDGRLERKAQLTILFFSEVTVL